MKVIIYLTSTLFLLLQSTQAQTFKSCPVSLSLSGFSPLLQRYNMNLSVCSKSKQHIKIHINYLRHSSKTVYIKLKKYKRLLLSIKQSIKELKQRNQNVINCLHPSKIRFKFKKHIKNYKMCDSPSDYFYRERLFGIFGKTYFQQW